MKKKINPDVFKQANQAWNSDQAQQLKKQTKELVADGLCIAGLVAVESVKALNNVFMQFKQRRRK